MSIVRVTAIPRTISHRAAAWILNRVLSVPPAVVHSRRDLGAERVLALTFDDGPSSSTPPILDLLRAHGAQATFFVLGKSVAGHEHVLRRAVEEQHELGNHLHSHTHPGWLTDDELRCELRQTQELVERATAVSPRLVRPPYGEDPDRVARVAAEIGLAPTVLWSVDPKDWLKRPAGRLSEEMIRAARPGAIVDLHDGVGVDPTVEALAEVLPALARQGYRFLTVSALLAASGASRARPLRASDLDRDPFRQFERWFAEARAAEIGLPEAMAVASATRSAEPSARMVLLKHVDRRGFVFHTHYESRKGKELAANPRAALLFYWHELGRQVRVEGAVRRLPERESDAYFRTRPPGGRLSAWASPQSEVVADRQALEARVEEARRRHGPEAPRPPFWGGFRLSPSVFEFWQHRDDRLHDRFRYRPLDAGWLVERLAP